MEKMICPICRKRHDNFLFKCDCGYEEDKERDYSNHDEYWFAIYKFSKAIFNKKINWEPSKLFVREGLNNRINIEEIDEDRAVAYVDYIIEGKQTVLTDGVLAFNYNVRSLIVNVDTISHDALDESGVNMLFLGDKVKDITELISISIKYLEVSKDNPYFTAKNNVLFNKKMTKLLFYCNQKPDEEYIVPASVKEVSSWAFDAIRHDYDALKVIHCSKKVKFKASRVRPDPYEKIKIIYDQD